MKLDTIEKIQKKLDNVNSRIKATKATLSDLQKEAKELEKMIEEKKLSEMVAGLEKKGLTVEDYTAWLNTHEDVVVEPKKRGRKKVEG